MIRGIKYFILALLATSTACNNIDNTEIGSGTFELAIDGKGFLVKMADPARGQNYIPEGISAPLMSVMVDNQISAPLSAQLTRPGVLRLKYPEDISASISFSEKESYITFELDSITAGVDVIIWGPYPSLLSKTIGETVGVVSDDNYAIGIQALNPRTLGGYPWNDNDCMPQVDVIDQDDPNDLSEEGKRYVLYRVEAARPTDYGSSLQAYCRNREYPRLIENLGYKSYVAPPYDDGGVIGSKIALFGCEQSMALNTIGEIELGENLPHPMINGVWAKLSPSAAAAYVILEFGESDINRAIELTEEAGLKYLYHPGPFSTWGHFGLRTDQFPSGREGFKRCVELASSKGITLGVHTLSNFITTNDPYVTPVPDSRLAKVGYDLLAEDADDNQQYLVPDDTMFFNELGESNLHTVMVGSELIRVEKLAGDNPAKLVDCQRGAFGTKAQAHSKGDTVSLLADHGYKVFLTNPALTIEVATNLAHFFNSTGAGQVSFDGVEGNRSTALGNYGEILFTSTWYNNLDESIRENYIADASRTSHYFWHIYSRMNWGEPWYAGFRESQTEYRLKNQPYFKRNLMPAMLGWFRLTSSTSVEDIEWMLARSAAFNAGYGLVVDYKSLDSNGSTPTILKLVGEWEKARMAGVFDKEQLVLMENVENEFHLEKIDSCAWNLFRVYSYKLKHQAGERQPGEPDMSTIDFESPSDGTVVNFLITAKGGSLNNIRMEIDNSRELIINTVLEEDYTLKYNGSDMIIKYDGSWNKLGEIPFDRSKMQLAKGDHTIDFGCSFNKTEESYANIELRLSGKPVVQETN